MTTMPKTRWAKTVDGACIAYQDFGDGPVAMVIIPAWFSHLEVYWEEPHYARFMRRLGRNLRVLSFDKRGLGMSDRVHGALGLEAQMDDVRAVMDAAGVERAALLGWGGFASAPLGGFLRRDLPRARNRLVHRRPCPPSPEHRLSLGYKRRRGGGIGRRDLLDHVGR